MFGSFGELTRHKLAAERSHIAEMLNMLIDPVVAIILDYVTIDPLIVDALSIKANSVIRWETLHDSTIHYEYSHAPRKGPCLSVTIFRRDPYEKELWHRSWIDHTRANALQEVMRLFTSNECTQLYYALIDGYRSILRSTPDVEYDGEPD
jgi:hypothetical protein